MIYLIRTVSETDLGMNFNNSSVLWISGQTKPRRTFGYFYALRM